MIRGATDTVHWRLHQLRCRWQVMRVRVHNAILLAADSTPAHLARKVLLQRHGFRSLEHVSILNHRQPERGQGIIVVAASVSVALDDRGSTELLQARAGRDQVLSVSSSVIRSVLWNEKITKNNFSIHNLKITNFVFPIPFSSPCSNCSQPTTPPSPLGNRAATLTDCAQR